MEPHRLRVALFSGNYNYVRDGANQALNRLVGYLIRQGATVRVYSPVTETPAFPPTGNLVPLPSIAFPGRAEYRFPTGLSRSVRRDLGNFKPDIVHVSSPDLAAHRALTYSEQRELPVVASVHTRFDTYPRYYGLKFVEPVMRAALRRFYRRCDALLAPSQSFADVLRSQRMNPDIGIWARGIDRAIFNPQMRDTAWLRSLGIADGTPVIGFLGRLVMEKGLDVFAEAIAALRSRGVGHHVLVIGEGPARDWFGAQLPGAVFAGFQAGDDLGRAVASMDILFNPSITETFGNVTLEAMACGVPVVAARATGSQSLVRNGETGRLVKPGDTDAFATALATYSGDRELRRAHGEAGAAASAAYDWDAINQAVLDTYRRVLAARQAIIPERAIAQSGPG